MASLALCLRPCEYRTATISDPSSTVATLAPDLPGTYRINLWGSDGTDSCFDRVNIEAESTNTAPVADAGDDQQSCSVDTIELRVADMLRVSLAGRR